MKTKEEIEWKDLPGYEGLYRVSYDGRVESYPKSWLSGRWVTRTHPGGPVPVFFDRKGYCIVNIRKDGKQKI